MENVQSVWMKMRMDSSLSQICVTCIHFFYSFPVIIISALSCFVLLLTAWRSAPDSFNSKTFRAAASDQHVSLLHFQVIWHQMRKVQHGLLQQRPGDESSGQRVSHGVFSVLGLQPTPPAGGRVLPAGRRAAVPGGPRLAGGAGLCREPAQPGEHSHQTAAHLR